MNPASLYHRKGLSLLFILAVYGLVYFPTLWADYVYLDEIHQLWHNQDHSNLHMFLTQGRLLTGLLFDKFFGSLSTIEQLKLLRLFSLGGWVLNTWLWSILFTQWARRLVLKDATLWLGNLFVICSPAVAIYIGWASCMELFLGVGVALLAGHLLFRPLMKGDERTRLPITPAFAALALGIISLFIYQTAYGAFLLPFFLYFVKTRGKLDRRLSIAVGVYFFTYVVYYFLFKYSLQVYGVPASDRTGINLDILSKIGFFFSGPLPQAFSLNWLYSSSNLVSQALYILLFLLWVVSVFRTGKGAPPVRKITYIVGVLFLIALIYLPLMIAKENFSSYRTLFAVSLGVFLLLVEDVFSLIKSDSTRRKAMLALTAAVLITGIYNYQVQFLNPLKKEYAALSNYFRRHYTADKLTVHFIRADRKLFTALYGTKVVKDEFGAPSSSRDWVPEPLIRQFITEMTGSREAAARVTIVQYESREQFMQSGAADSGKSLVIDVNELLHSTEQKR